MEKNDITVKILLRQLMKEIQDKYKEIQTKTNEVLLLDIFQNNQEWTKLGKPKKNNSINGSNANKNGTTNKFEGNCHFLWY